MRKRRRIANKKVYNIIKIVILLLAIIFLGIIAIIARVYITNKNDITNIGFMASLSSSIKVEKEKEIIEEEPNGLRTENVVEEYDIEYTTIYQEDDTLPKGMIQVVQEGRTGKIQVLIKKTYQDLELVDEEKISEKLVKAPMDKIVVTGTSKYKSNYKIRVGDILYVTSATLGIKIDMDTNSDKIITIDKDEKVEVLEINGDWYKVAYENYEGYIASDTVTYIPPASEYDDAEGLPRDELLGRLSFNMNINAPSGLSLEQFKKVLSNIDRDTNRVMRSKCRIFLLC